MKTMMLQDVSYVDFIFRPPPPNQALSLSQTSDDILLLSLCSFAAFSVACMLLPHVLRRYTTHLDDQQKRAELPVYICSLLHHLVVVPCAFLSILRDYNSTEAPNYVVLNGWWIPFSFGYLLADTLFYAIGAAAHGQVETLFHHILGGGLFYLAYICPGHILRFVPHILMCESSAICFNSAWLLRNICGYRDGFIIHTVEIMFAVLFFLTRVVNLPLVCWAVLDLAGDLLFLGRAVLFPIIGLQYFWMFKILRSLMMKQLKPKSKN